MVETRNFLDSDFDSKIAPEKLAVISVEACLESLNNLRKIESLKLSESLVGWISVLEQLLSNPEKIDKKISEEIVKNTVILFDLFLVDEIADYSRPSDFDTFQNFYYRDRHFSMNNEMSLNFRSLGDILWMKPEELSATIEYVVNNNEKSKPQSALARGGRMHLVDSLNQLPGFISAREGMGKESSQDALYSIFITQPQSLRRVGDFNTIFQNMIGYGIFNIYVPVYLDDNVSGILHFSMNSFSKFFGYPLSSYSRLPRQEVWRSMLQQGVALFPNKGKMPADLEEDSKDPERPIIESIEDIFSNASQELDPRKVILFRKIYNLLFKRDSVDTNELKSKHAEYYQGELGREHSHFGSGEVTLTRSGNSANETAINTAISFLESQGVSQVRAYLLNGFYYESKPTVIERCDVVDSLDEADILLMAHQAITPNGHFSPEKYQGEVHRLIESMKQRAVAHPEKIFFIVYDKTQDIGAQVFGDGEDMPQNLVVFETASLSKFQRGGVNYFYGILQDWKPDLPELSDELSKQLLLSRSGLTEMGVVSFPHITKGEIQRRIERNSSTRKKVEEFFKMRNERLPENEQVFIDYTNFSFYIIPAELHTMLELSRNNERKLSGSEIKKKIKDLENPAASLWYSNFKSKAKYYPTITAGDSFGMHETRITNFSTTLKIAEANIRVLALRVSYGLDTSDDELLRFLSECFA